ncbi:serine/threonine-protein kinase 19 homolog isoform X1 [Salvia hispanica]|uniref:serine/threonine-protein kinase 19 homolog isoform X1 n=2 Tax=Salvia hispanica TaxID=49212 RepID=UPI002008FECB|nr:serine/threonine-protein kinase 19 homolog isoform X1 [Salvia hispanica]XP_047982681.1 serine/threonine-protein kinase 19 homolog isoform X1 [Salvia hispanica]XP_047982682.1 serine/threonine-protein kinase 19 homolog isoform X1 [Salvia hispanica]XP_047982683.1 serine/threonine-protein kinase 19 homolog isoform X1 [Salvia hispanica]
MSNKIPESEPSTSRKRRRNEEPEPQSENDVVNSHSLSLEDNFAFSDTLMALRMMRAQFPHIQKVSVPPFVLQSQLYSSIKNRTEVDREIESLKREKVVRIFKLNTGQDDHAIMFIDDYISQIERVVKRMEENSKNDLVVFEWFKIHVLQSKLETSIGHQELWSFLSLGGKVKEDHISHLISAGLLIRQLIDQNMYWFSIPNIGSVLKGLSQGRKELMSLLSRRKYKEMMMAALEVKRLRFSPLDMRFHLRDLIGSGQLKTIQTPSGLIVRVAKD